VNGHVSFPNIIRMIKSRRVRFVRHVRGVRFEMYTDVLQDGFLVS